MNDEHYMRQCIGLAQAASENGEVPVGAIIFDADGRIIAEAANAPISGCDPSAHAEILALRQAAKALGNYRLVGCTLYVTLEPCTMCAGAISHARIARLVYGASDPKGGAIENGVKFFENPNCHHRPEVTAGILSEDCGAMLKAFFRAKRAPS